MILYRKYYKKKNQKRNNLLIKILLVKIKMFSNNINNATKESQTTNG